MIISVKNHKLSTDLIKSCLIIVAILLTLPMEAAAPKREMRATWLTTVANIDWPSANTTDIAAQKKELTRMLDSIQSINMNTVFFHIRPACDALYQSDYEPWSSYLNHGRGVNPGYDPLQFCIEECHKRGLTCHGWINPYRYGCRGSYDWTGNNDTTLLNYKHTHPEWLLWYKSDIILDPALPAVRQQIKRVVGDIINKYDIDGILMDDYFYPYGGTTTQDSASVRTLKPGDISTDDWRRQNVNKMVKEVYDTIQAVKPWVTFGVSPFGIWTTNYVVAQQRGYTLPDNITGGNMYQEIYCDPVAWLEEGTVDYLSPQLYWKIGGAQDYKTLSKWWGDICNRFGKHFYSSMAIYRYEQGTAGFSVSDMQQQAQLNRTVTDNTPGAVFYQTTGWVYDKKFRKAFKGAEFAYPALPPAINWKTTGDRAMVENLTIDGQTLSWAHADSDVHFAVYAVQNAFRNRVGIYSLGETLLGITYSTSFTLPEDISARGYQIAVSVLDKYNNEYAMRILGAERCDAVSTVLQSPADGDARKLPFVFQWSFVPKADSYVIQVARDAAMTDIVMAQEVTTTSFSTDMRLNLGDLPLGTYYWRVKTRIPNSGDCWSEVRKVIFSTADAVEDIRIVSTENKKWIEDNRLHIAHDNRVYDILGNVCIDNK